MAEVGMPGYGSSGNELFIQFLARIAREIPTATVAMFSTLKYINAQASQQFRDNWNARYLDGFVIHNKAFDGLRGDFPIGFLIWQTDNGPDAERTPITTVSCEAYDKNVVPMGQKCFYNFSVDRFLSRWIDRPKPNSEKCVPLTNAITPQVGNRKDQRGIKWSDGAVGFLCSGGNDFQNTKYINLVSSGFSRGHGIFVNKDNLHQCAIYFTMTKIIRPMWLNDRDQFLQPTGVISEEFANDCLVWMLFNGSNNTASADGLEWNGRSWSIVDHFIPYTEVEVDSPERFESDFLVRFMENLEFSPEAQAVLDEGRKLWRIYFAMTDEYSVREKYKLNRPDVGWYQIRNALRERNESGSYAPIDFTEFENSYSRLTEKLRPMVYELGFLKR